MNEIFSSEEMKRFEQEQFLKRNSYSFMQKAGDQIFKFINNRFKNKRPIIVLLALIYPLYIAFHV